MSSKHERQKLRGGVPRKDDGLVESGSGDVGNFYGAATSDPTAWLYSTGKWLESSKDTDPTNLITYCCEDFRPRKLKAPVVLAWLLLQAGGLIFQIRLYGEIGQNLDLFEQTLAAHCGPEHQQNGVCLGPAWNMSWSGNLSFPASAGEDSQSDFDFIIPSDQTFRFETKSKPPTFLLGIEPLSPNNKASWKAIVAPREGGNSWGSARKLPEVHGSGSKYTVLSSKFYGGPSWSGSVNLRSKLAEEVHIHVYVVDSRIEHLEEVHKQPQCNFENSWQNFNERHNGEHHRVLSAALRATGFFLFVQMLLVASVSYRFFYSVESGKLLSRLIAFKFVVQDLPQQICIIMYLYGWYANNGLRCQMCLFHPQHCDDQHPLHGTNLLLCVFTLLSACANQLLLQAKLKKYDEEEECLICFARLSMFSISSLPFNTAMFLLANSLFHLHSVLVYFVVGIPTLIGWGSVLCVPVFTLCDEDDDMC